MTFNELRLKHLEAEITYLMVEAAQIARQMSKSKGEDTLSTWASATINIDDIGLMYSNFHLYGQKTIGTPNHETHMTDAEFTSNYWDYSYRRR